MPQGLVQNLGQARPSSASGARVDEDNERRLWLVRVNERLCSLQVGGWYPAPYKLPSPLQTHIRQPAESAVRCNTGMGFMFLGLLEQGYNRKLGMQEAAGSRSGMTEVIMHAASS